MKKNYIISIDQSTSTTKAVLFDNRLDFCGRIDIAHRQIVNDKGWIEHNPEEIYSNIIKAVKKLLEITNVDKNLIIGAALSNQRETSIVWNKHTGKPIYNAIVWQCARSESICKKLKKYNDIIKKNTGTRLSPFFSASKIAWILKNIKIKNKDDLCASTMDSWILYNLSKEKVIKTDYSNASRTQLFNLKKLKWDDDITSIFGIKKDMLPEVCNSNDLFCYTNFDGIFNNYIPICGVLGDSHAALLAQGCLNKGEIKATYGTGSSVMMNTDNDIIYDKGLTTSIAWSIDNNIQYVLEGNINYTGAIIKWLEEDLRLIDSSKDVSQLAKKAHNMEDLYIVPAFSGLSSPYWVSKIKANIYGITRNTRKEEIVRACEEAIAYQISDIVFLMQKVLKNHIEINYLKVDGGPTKDDFLMQFQSDISNLHVKVSNIEELSAMGAAFASGIKLGLYDINIINNKKSKIEYIPRMDNNTRNKLYKGWKSAVYKTIN